MANKLTLITPPDFYENSNFSILFLGLNEAMQDAASFWLSENSVYPDTNLYYYQGENNPTWLLYALGRSDVKFLNLDAESAIIHFMSSYILSRPNVYYTTADENLKALMSHINNNYVSSVAEFLEKVFNVEG